MLIAILILNDYTFLRVIDTPQESKLKGFTKFGLEVSQLIEGLIMSHNRKILGLGAKITSRNPGNIIQMYGINRVEIIIAIVSYDEYRVFVYQHQSPHLFVKESSYEITHRDFFLVIFVLALSLLCTQVNFKQVMVFIYDERRCFMA